MTNDLEKTFFDTFGIEPKLNSPCEQLLQNKYCNENSGSRDTFFDPYPYCVGFENCAKGYKERVWFYPKITDRILLELICILSEWRTYLHSSYTIKANNTLNLKQDVLKDFLELFKWYEFKKCEKGIKHQVRTLFEEG